MIVSIETIVGLGLHVLSDHFGGIAGVSVASVMQFTFSFSFSKDIDLQYFYCSFSFSKMLIYF